MNDPSLRVQRKPLRTGHQVTLSSPWPHTHTHRRTTALPLPFHTNRATHSCMSSSFPESKLRDEKGDFMQPAAVPAWTCATQQRTIYTTQQTQSPPPPPIFACILSPDPSVLIPFPAPSFVLPSPLQQWRMMTSTPFHLTSCKTHNESHSMDSFSKTTTIRSFSTRLQGAYFRSLAQMINKESVCYITCFQRSLAMTEISTLNHPAWSQIRILNNSLLLAAASHFHLPLSDDVEAPIKRPSRRGHLRLQQGHRCSEEKTEAEKRERYITPLHH